MIVTSSIDTKHITSQLRKSGLTVRKEQAERWRFSYGRGKNALKGTLMLNEDWLLMDSIVSQRNGQKAGASLWQQLLWNDCLPGQVKYARSPQQPNELHLRAEIPLVDRKEPETFIAPLVAGIRLADSLAKNSGDLPLPETVAIVTEKSESPTESENDFVSLCEQIGWPYDRRASGSVSVELESVDESLRALLVEMSDGTFRAQAELLNDLETQPACRMALALLLLTTNGLVRMVRATGWECDGNAIVGFEVPFMRFPSADYLTHALSALSIASRICAAESAVLTSEKAAEEYLRIRGYSS